MDRSCQKFGLNIMEIVCRDDFDTNIIYSPLSIFMALGMTLYGSKNVTSLEMMQTLHWDKNNSEIFHQHLSECIKTSNIDNLEILSIKIANKLFLEEHYELLDSYSKAMSKFYEGGIEKMNFKENPDKSRLNINSWVEEQTKGKIRDLLPPRSIHSLTRLILVNAIYFKGSWINEFSLIGDHEFHLLNGGTKSTKMMSKTSGYKYLQNSELEFSAVQIPFKGIQNNHYSLMVILPNEKCSLPKLEKSVFQREWSSLFSNDLFEHKSVCIKIPKFKIECSFSLKEKLETLGMKAAFSMEADFSLMTGNRDLVIDDVIHKAFIDVDEHGVEAAAATAVMMFGCSLFIPVIPIDFICDHPFMFAIVNENGLPLFMGHLTQC